MTRQQVNGINFLLDAVEADPYITRIEWFAYMLATVKAETADTFQPIHEYGGHNYFVRRYGSQTKVGKGLGNLTPEDGATFAGRGDVQLTGRSNYQKATKALKAEYPQVVADYEARTGAKFDLEQSPEEATDPALAYAIMSHGMRVGMFTGKGLADYTTPASFYAKNARRIINGLDHADLIAGYYSKWLSILKTSLVKSQIPAAAIPTAVLADLKNDKLQNQPESDEDPATQQQPDTIVQTADTIVNTGDNAAASSPPGQDVTITAPEGLESVQSSAKIVIAGITIPTMFVPAVRIIQDLITNGVIDAKQIADTTISLIQHNFKYILLLIGGVVIMLAIKKICRELIFLVTVISHAVPSWNSIQIVAPDSSNGPQKPWWRIW